MPEHYDDEEMSPRAKAAGSKKGGPKGMPGVLIALGAGPPKKGEGEMAEMEESGEPMEMEPEGEGDASEMKPLGELLSQGTLVRVREELQAAGLDADDYLG